MALKSIKNMRWYKYLSLGPWYFLQKIKIFVSGYLYFNFLSILANEWVSYAETYLVNNSINRGHVIDYFNI